MRQYATLKKEYFDQNDLNDMKRVCEELKIEGTEVFMDDICPRTQLLFENECEKKQWIEELNKLCVKRIHCSYWAYPTSFLTKNNYSQLIERFGGIEAVRDYYGDLTGNHMFLRWMQEYEIATALDAQSYTFHLIDYAPIDGMWEFTISREDIRQAMVFMIQHFLNVLLENGIMSEDSPQIKLENAGFGLEYGIQTAEDYRFVFSQLYDPYKKVKIGWDVNHLLHALGFREETQRAEFFLTEKELTKEMKELEESYNDDPKTLAEKWISYNILHPDTVEYVGAIQLSDCNMKTEEFFRNGKFKEPYHSEISKLTTWEEKEEYGVKIVLSEYDSHVILGEGSLREKSVCELLRQINQQLPELALLHELKNSPDMKEAIKEQKEKIEEL